MIQQDTKITLESKFNLDYNRHDYNKYDYEEDQYIQAEPQRENYWCEILARNVQNLPWSPCVKTQRGTSVNGVKENCRDFYD